MLVSIGKTLADPLTFKVKLMYLARYEADAVIIIEEPSGRVRFSFKIEGRQKL